MLEHMKSVCFELFVGSLVEVQTFIITVLSIVFREISHFLSSQSNPFDWLNIRIQSDQFDDPFNMKNMRLLC